MNRPGPAPERGGTPSALDAVRKRSGLTKARKTSVIADMTRVEETVGEPRPATLHADAARAAESEQTTATAFPALEQASTQALHAQQAPAGQQPAPEQAHSQGLLRQPAPEAAEPEKKLYRKTSFFQSKESGARMRSTYMATRHLTGSRTLSDFILAAVEREVEALERQYNQGNLFTADPGSVPRGRPLET